MFISVSKELQDLVPYKAGKPIKEAKRETGFEKIIKLASNENPLGLSKKVEQFLQQALSNGFRYPDPSAYDLRQALGKYYSISPENIAVGNGSNELIDLLVRVFCDPREPYQAVLTSESAFVAYEVCAKANRIKFIQTPMTADYKFDLKEMKKMALEQKPRLIFIANPNNPTGTYVSHNELEEFLRETESLKDTLIVLDEAYYEYVQAADYPKSFELQKEFPRLVILRTMSKAFSLAGFRLGALFADISIIEWINKVRLPFNVNSLAQQATVIALSDKDHIERSVRLNNEGLNYLYTELKRLKIKYWPSQTNFILLELPQVTQKVYERLLQQGVIVRPVLNYNLPHCLRVSVGLPEENQFFIKCLEKSIIWEMQGE